MYASASQVADRSSVPGSNGSNAEMGRRWDNIVMAVTMAKPAHFFGIRCYGKTCFHKQQNSETTNVLAAMKGKGAERDKWCLQLPSMGPRKVPGDTVDTGSRPIVFRVDLKM